MSDDPQRAVTDRYSITIWHRAADGGDGREAFLDEVPDADRLALAQAIAPTSPTMACGGWRLTLTRIDGARIDGWAELPDDVAAMFRDSSALYRPARRGRR